MNLSRPDHWYHRATLYQIYPLSFADSNGDGYGDIRGIINHLDYLNDGTSGSLGVNAIWLSPIYASPMADWGYDVSDHMAIDPIFGTMEDFDELLVAVHTRGMKLLMDYVPNHTSHLHDWFKESKSSLQNDKRTWYVWADPSEEGGPPNNWLSRFGGSAWTLDPTTDQYYLHTFLPEQPDLNWHNPAVRQAMLGVLRFWLSKGVDGFRADAVRGLVKDELLRDDPPNPDYIPGITNPADEFLLVNSGNENNIKSVIGSYCEVLSEHEDKFLLSEAYLNIPGLHSLYEACRDHPVHAPFNFNLMKLDWSASSYRDFIDEYESALGPDDWPNYVLGNHDQHRLATRVGPDRARLLAMLQLTLRGLPVLYYGDELGLEDAVLAVRQVRDRWEMRVPGYGLGRDVSRSPMPWTNSADAGFTTSKPWLPIDVNTRSNNVELQERRPDSSFNLYRHLIRLRMDSPALMIGDYRSLSSGNSSIYAYVRETGLQRFTILLNFSDSKVSFDIQGTVGIWVAGTQMIDGDGLAPSKKTITLDPYEGRAYELRRGETK